MRPTAIVIVAIILILPASVLAKYTIKNVECYTGEDFVQLHFKSSQIIPIPDLFYPEKDNYQFLVMRISQTDFDIPQKRLHFDSPVIRNLQIVDNKEYVDVEIRLKEKVNYRVFTNRNGVYLEFPNVKEIEPAQPTPTQTRAAELKKESPPVKKTQEKVAAFPVAAPAASGGPAVIRSHRVTEKGDGRIKFEFELSHGTEYKVIPIPDEPVRLAIDLKNTKSRRLFESIDYLNVKNLRGAVNSPTVFRLVFDLDYLENYGVNLKGNRLQVEFFNQPVVAASTRTQVKEPEENPAIESHTTTQPAAVKPKPSATGTTPPETETTQSMSNPVPKITMVTPVAEKTVQPDKNEVVQSKAQTVNPVSQKGEFFSSEKSQVAKDHYESSYLDDPEESGSDQAIDQTITTGEKQYTGNPMDFNFKNADLNNVLLFFAKISGLNILIDPGVSGKVTATMFQVPWDQALEHFLKINGLDMIQEGNILRIGAVDKLAREAEQRRKLKEARELEGDLEVWPVALSYAQVAQIKPILEKYLSQRGEIVLDQRTNQLIITDVPWRRATIDSLIDTLDLPTRQVSIEARIVETATNYSMNFGIQWGFASISDAAYGNQTTLAWPNSVLVDGGAIVDANAPGLQNPNTLNGYAINLPAPVFTSGVGMSLGNVANTFRLDAAITAMEEKGKGRIISAPKTTTQNNMQASIMQGRQIPVQTIQNNTVTTRYVPAALELEVTPQITADGTIITTLAITNNSADFSNLVQGIPPIITQEINTTVMVKDGATIVIGGLYRVEDAQKVESVPLLSKIPLLGNLFKNNQKLTDQKELLIFITPRIIK